MTTFIDCIRTAVTTGKIKAEKGQKAEDAFNEIYADQIAAGATEAAARDAATQEAVNAIAKLNAEQRWKRINEMRKAHAIHERFSTTKDIPLEMDKFFNEVEIAYQRNVGMSQAMLADMIDHYRPRAAGLSHPIQDMDDVARAAHGEQVSNGVAKAMADALHDTFEFMRKRANLEGASIPENPNRRLPQTHDRLKVRQVTRDEWVNEHLDRLDWDLMRLNDRPIPVAARRSVLETVYDGISTDGASRLKPGQTAADQLATRLSRSRFLYYKDAASYLEMQKKYGSGNIFQQTIASIDSMARDTAMLEKFGPNPAGMKSYLRNTAMKNAGDADLASDAASTTKKKSKFKKGAEEAVDRFDKQYEIFTLGVLNGEENLMAQGMATLRTFINSNLLAGAYISNLNDFAFVKNYQHANKIPGLNITQAYLKFFNPVGKTPEQNAALRKLAIRSGLIAESATAHASSYQRYFGAMDGSRIARNYSDVLMRLTWMTPHQQALKWAWGMEMMGRFADDAKVKFDDLPYKELMQKYGLTSDDWNMFRKTKLYDEQGATFLRPIDMAKASGGSGRQQRVADKFLDFIQGTTREVVLTPGTKLDAIMGKFISSSTVLGQVTRTGGSLLTFPVSIMLMSARQILDNPTAVGRLGATARFMAYLTIGGAMITQLKSVLQGKDPENMATPEFWGKAALNGGSMGLAGDLVFGGNFTGKSLAERVAGPGVQFASDTAKLTLENIQQVLDGKDTNAKAELINYMTAYGPKPWQIRLLIDRYIRDTLLQYTDPAAFRKLKKTEAKRIQETGQDAWWKAGERSPKRAPDFSKVFGE